MSSVVGLLVAWSGLLTSSVPASPSQDPRDFFERRVRPVLVEHCTTCHGVERQRGGLRLDHGRGLREGGDGGPVVVPGDPAASRLVQAVHYGDVDLQMPPRGKLSAERIAALERWVADGAWWPPENMEPAEPAAEAEAFDLQGRRSSHWAWSPLSDPPVPEVGHPAWPRDPVDAFLLARLEAAGLLPAEDAEDAAWLRRVHFDLIGLPPTREELDAFLADASPEREAKVVDRLLASPHFGERWGRHWLDLVRYAESYGHEFDYSIPEPWRYRDYVIRGLNADVPFDDWLREHVAGDLLESPRRHPEEGFDESILGTGFWHFHQANHGAVDVREDEAERVDNQIDVLSKTFLGLTVACARCHDHKFDAISTADFYALAGFLQSSRREFTYLDPHQRIAGGQQRLRALAEQARGPWRRAAEEAAAQVDRLAAALDQGQAFVDTLPVARAVEHEGEALPERRRDGGEQSTQQMTGYRDRWSGDAQLWWIDATPGQILELGLPVPATGRYEIVLDLTKARDYGRFRVLLDGAVVLDEVDLYDPEVVPSGPISLGLHELVEGERLLGFEVLGAHPDAIPRHMFGLDRVRLTPNDGLDAEREASRKALGVALGFDDERLARWTTALSEVRADDRAHPLHAWSQLRGEADPAAFEQRAAKLEEEAAAREGREGEVLFETFEDGFEDWYVRGQAFGDGPTAAGEWNLPAAAQPGRERATLPAGLAHSGRWSGKLQGALRSKTFTLQHRHLHYRVAGTGGQIRVIIDGYFMDTFNSLLYAGVSFDVRHGEELRWHDQTGDLSKYVGHRVHLEILDHGDGWIAVDEIRLSDEGPRAREERSVTRAVLAEARGAVAGGAAPREALAAAYQEVAPRVLRDPAAFGRQGRVLGDWLGRSGLLPASPAQTELANLAAEGAAIGEALPAPIKSLALGDGNGEDEYVFIRGSHRLPGDTVPRRFLTALHGEERRPRGPGSGRLELAEQMLAEDEPFVPRVEVNRVWHHLFGRGIVPTPDNFGVLGEPPSHPQLLDHLATWFRTEAGWSRKALIRRLVLTRAYRMSSALRDARAEEADPGNVLLHRMRVKRLEGEVLRDALLAVAGRLDPTLFGPSVPVHLTSFMQGRGRPGSGPLDGNGRRSVYLSMRRNFISSMMLAFDAPLPHTTVGRRTVSNVPAQALILLNDPLVHELAEEWSRHLRESTQDEASFVERAYREALARPPTAAESRRAMAFLQEQAGRHGGGDEARSRAHADLCHVLFNLKEFVFVP